MQEYAGIIKSFEKYVYVPWRISIRNDVEISLQGFLYIGLMLEKIGMWFLISDFLSYSRWCNVLFSDAMF